MNNIWELLTIGILEIGLCIWFLCKRYGSRQQAMTTALAFVISLFVSVAASRLSMPPGLRVVLMIALMFAYTTALGRKKYLNKLFFSTLAVLMVGLADLLVVATLSMVTGISIAILASMPAIHIQGALISKSVLFVLFFLLTRRQMDHALRGPLWWLLYSIPVVSIVVLFLFMRQSITIPAQSITMGTLTIGLLFISFASIFLYDQLALYTEKALREELMAQQVSALQSHIEEIERISTESRGLRHDMANHLQALHGLIENGNSDEALSYVMNLEQVHANHRLRVNTGHAVVDAIIASKLSYAEGFAIDVECDVALPEKIDITPMELCSVLGNLLDNAIEACRKVPEGRKLRLDLRERAGQLIVVIENSYLPQPSLLRSHKGKGHGIGLLNVRQIIANHEGIFEIEQAPDRFIARALIPNNSQPLMHPD